MVSLVKSPDHASAILWHANRATDGRTRPILSRPVLEAFLTARTQRGAL